MFQKPRENHHNGTPEKWVGTLPLSEAFDDSENPFSVI